MAPKKPIITLLTDFGLHDHFVGTMKGVIMNIHPDVTIVDICHDVPPHDILQAAFLLKSAYTYFPSGTIHVVVVDPGVGTERKPIIISSEKGYFIAPDNGVLSYIYAEDNVSEVREITADHYFAKPRSGTFDGRDVFAPVAAWLSKGVGFALFGDLITEYKKFEIPVPVPIQQGALKCKIVYVDRFGNLISNLPHDRFKELLDSSEDHRFAFRVGKHTVSKISQSYTEGEKGELIAIFGSSGCVEFSVNQGNAAQFTKLYAGKDVFLKVM
jgi:S-adenosylmethionine hydrolase